MPVLGDALSRHWAALLALAAIALSTLLLAGWESGATEVPVAAPADGKVISAAVAVGSDGTSYAVWVPYGGDRIEVATGRDGELGEPRSVPVPDRLYAWAWPRISAGRDSALVAIQLGGAADKVIALRLSRDGAVIGPRLVSTTPATDQYLEVATADDGSGVIAWESDSPLEKPDGNPHVVYVLNAVTVDAGLGIGPEQRLTQSAGSNWPSLAVAPDGRAALAWAELGTPAGLGVNNGGPIALVEAAPGGTFGPRVYAPDAVGEKALGNAVTIAYTRDGDLRAAWVEQRGAGPGEIDTGVTAVGSDFRDRAELARNTLSFRPTLVSLAGGELVGFARAGPDGYLPEDRAWYDVFALKGARVVRHDPLASRGVNENNDPVAPWLEQAGPGALAVWGSRDELAAARCSLTGCADPGTVVTAGRREQLQFVGADAATIGWLEGRYESGYDFKVGKLD